MMRVAVVGLGIGRIHVEEYKAKADAELAAVVDTNEKIRQGAAEEYGVPAFGTITEMLGSAKIDAVSLCTPPGVHAEQTEELAAAGIHVLVEKPMAPSLEHCKRMMDAARDAGVKLMVAQKKRFSALYIFLKEKFGSEWGPPRWASIKYAVGRVDKPWFWAEDDGGGPLVENAIHVFDLLRFLMGEVDTVFAAGGNLFRPDFPDQIDTATAALKFKNGACAAVACGYASEWGFADERISMTTEKVCCEIAGSFDRANTLTYIRRDDPDNPVEEVFEDPGDFRREIAEFLSCIEEDRTPAVTGEDAAKSIALALAVKKSIREGRPIDAT